LGEKPKKKKRVSLRGAAIMGFILLVIAAGLAGTGDPDPAGESIAQDNTPEAPRASDTPGPSPTPTNTPVPTNTLPPTATPEPEIALMTIANDSYPQDVLEVQINDLASNLFVQVEMMPDFNGYRVDETARQALLIACQVRDQYPGWSITVEAMAEFIDQFGNPLTDRGMLMRYSGDTVSRINCDEPSNLYVIDVEQIAESWWLHPAITG
jgi:hypothetical protein